MAIGEHRFGWQCAAGVCVCRIPPRSVDEHHQSKICAFLRQYFCGFVSCDAEPVAASCSSDDDCDQFAMLAYAAGLFLFAQPDPGCVFPFKSLSQSRRFCRGGDIGFELVGGFFARSKIVDRIRLRDSSRFLNWFRSKFTLRVATSSWASCNVAHPTNRYHTPTARPSQ